MLGCIQGNGQKQLAEKIIAHLKLLADRRAVFLFARCEMLTKEETISDILAKIERVQSQEIKTADNARRILNAFELEEKLNNLIDEALLYIGMNEIKNSTPDDLHHLVLVHKRDAELHQLNPGDVKPKRPNPPDKKDPKVKADDFLYWRDEMRASGFKCTYKMVAAECNYSADYLRQRNSQRPNKIPNKI